MQRSRLNGVALWHCCPDDQSESFVEKVAKERVVKEDTLFVLCPVCTKCGRYKIVLTYACFFEHNMAPYLHRHRPLIASRIEFAPLPPLPLPSIGPRIEFTAERLARTGQDYCDYVRLGGHGNRSEGTQVLGTPQLPITGPITIEPVTPKLAERLASDKIPKPPGEPGRPGSGGFCVSTTLKSHGWTEESVDKLTVCFVINHRFKHIPDSSPECSSFGSAKKLGYHPQLSKPNSKCYSKDL